MDTVLVTGSTGFVGANIVHLLCAKGYHVRVLIRESSDRSNIEDLNLDIVLGDLLDRASLQKSLQGISHVFHVAANYRLWTRNPQTLYDANVQGTVNLMEVCNQKNVSKIVYTSSVATVGKAAQGLTAKETDIGREKDMIGHYKRSKFLAEKAVMDMAKEGLPVIIVNPSAPIGPYDIKPTPTGKIVVDFLNGKMPAYLNTGLNLVDVRDVAYGHYLAWKKGTFGRRYILGGENVFLKDFFARIAHLVGTKAPKVCIPFCIAYALGYMNEAWSILSQKEPRIPIDGVRMAKRVMFFDSSRAEKELGYRSSTIDQAILDAMHFFLEKRYICSK